MIFTNFLATQGTVVPPRELLVNINHTFQFIVTKTHLD